MKSIAGWSVFTVFVFLFAVQAHAQNGKVEILWLGQAATRITTPSGKVIVIDPYLSKNPKTPEQYRDPEALGKVDLLLVTHAHNDHLGDAPDIVRVVPQQLAHRMGQGGSVMPFGPNGAKIIMSTPSTTPSSSGTIQPPAKTRFITAANLAVTSSNSKTVLGFTTWAIPGCSAT